MNAPNILASRRLAKMQCFKQNSNFNFQVVTLREVTNKDSSHKKNTKWHKHSFYEIHILRQGEFIYQFENNEAYPLHAMQAILISPDTMHRVLRRSDNYVKDSFSFRIDTEQENSTAKQIVELFQRFPYTAIPEGEILLNLCDQIFAEVLRQDFGFEHVIHLYQQHMILETARALYDVMPVSGAESNQNLHDERIMLIKNYISDNLSMNITNSDISDHLHMCSKQLDRIVQRECGCTLHKLINDMKCAYAKELLQNPQIPLSVIAERTGFSNEYSFGRFFKRVEGMPPGMYRRDFLITN